MRRLYEILITGAWNSDESAKARDAGWIWTVRSNEPGCHGCGAWGGFYLKDGGCLSCRKEEYADIDANWTSDAALAR